SQGAGAAPGRRLEKLATSITSPPSRSSVRASRSDQASVSSGVLAQPAASMTNRQQRLERIAGTPGGVWRMAQRAVDFGSEARQRAEQRVAVETVQHALPLALAADQPGALEHRQVARDRRPAHGEALGEIGG